MRPRQLACWESEASAPRAGGEWPRQRSFPPPSPLPWYRRLRPFAGGSGAGGRDRAPRGPGAPNPGSGGSVPHLPRGGGAEALRAILCEAPRPAWLLGWDPPPSPFGSRHAWPRPPPPPPPPPSRRGRGRRVSLLLKTSEGGPAERAVPELGGEGEGLGGGGAAAAAAGSVKRLRRAGRPAACSCAWPAAGGVSAQEAGLRGGASPAAGECVCGEGGLAAGPGFRAPLLRRA